MGSRVRRYRGHYRTVGLAFEAVVIEVIKACASVNAACELLKLEWLHVHAIMERDVQRGMGRRRGGGLKIDQDWAFEELFANFWEQPAKQSAHIFIKKWCSRVKKPDSTLSKSSPQWLSVISMGYSTTSSAV
jgi:hypothetical protein